MKLKYYFRGLGMGILFATIIMAISSSIHKNDISDEEIIKRAQQLGMVMAESTDKHDGLWGKPEDTQSEDIGSNTEGGLPEDTQASTDSVQPQDSQMSTESSTSQDNSTDVDNKTDSESQDSGGDTAVTYVEITIESQELAQNVAESLFYKGAITDADSFHRYLLDHGYTRFLKCGTFLIPVGATYEEICDIIVHK